ncbi:MAG: hypothetical protein KGI11_09415 [Thaumarchaeota archaeon]|nr:hypothetical protein [Nitrososphaerota archaeon]
MECIEIFALLVKSDKPIQEGQKITTNDLVKLLKPKFIKVIFSDELKAEEILNWLVDAIQYCRGITDTMPAFETVFTP